MVTVVVAVAPDGSVGGDGHGVLVVGVVGVLVVEGRGGADCELAGCGVYGEQGGVGASEGVVESFVVGRGDGVADGVARGCVLGYGAGCRLALGEGRQDVIGRVSIDGDAPRLDRADPRGGNMSVMRRVQTPLGSSPRCLAEPKR